MYCNISGYKECINATSPLEVRLASCTGSLSWALQFRFDIMKDDRELKAAQQCIDGVLNRPVPLPAKDEAFLQNRLGVMYIRSFFASNNMDLLDTATTCFCKAINTGCTMPEQSNPPVVNMARTLMHKFEIIKSNKDLFAVTSASHEVMGLLQNFSHWDRRGFINSISHFCTLLYDTKEKDILGEKPFSKMAIKLYSIICGDLADTPRTRIYAAMQIACLQYEMHQDAPASRDSLVSAIQLLPEAILMGPNQGDHLRRTALPGDFHGFQVMPSHFHWP